MRSVIVSIGEPMVEFNQARTDQPEFQQGFGGDTSNCVIAAARQGASARYLTRVGRDAFGELLLTLWQREGVDVRYVEQDEQAATGVYFVTHGPAGHQFSYLRAGSAASRMSPAWLRPEMLADARFLHVSGITQAISASACDTAFAAMRLAAAQDVEVAYDPNLRLKLWGLDRARATVRAAMGLSDVVLVSSDDAQALTGERTADGMRASLHSWGARVLLLKLGAEGVEVAHDGRVHAIPGMRVDAVDATGAGDCFAGAFLARRAAGDDLLAAARYANVAAGLSTRGYGAIAPIPTADEVRRHL